MLLTIGYAWMNHHSRLRLSLFHQSKLVLPMPVSVRVVRVFLVLVIIAILLLCRKVMLLQKQKKQYQMYWSTPLTSIKKVSLTHGTNELVMVISTDSLFKKKHGSKQTHKVIVEDNYGAMVRCVCMYVCTYVCM